MIRILSLTLALTIFGVSDNEAAKILVVVPTPSISHQVVFRPIVQELAKRGHEVVIVTTDPAFPKGQAPTNLTEIDVHDESYKKWEAFVATSTGDQNVLFNQVRIGFGLIARIFIQQMETKEVKNVLKNEKFDLLIIEALCKPALVLSHLLKIPVIQVSSFGAVVGNYETVGAPVHPILYPTIFRQKIIDLTLWEKAIELYNHYFFIRLDQELQVEHNAMLKKVFGPDVPDISKMLDNVDMMFLNVHPLFESNRPVPPNVIFMGGLHQNPVKELPKELKSYLDASKHGVIYISFGTNVNPSQLPKERIQILTKVFSTLPYDVLWKWDKEELPGRSENIRISKWLPQSDLLRHPKIKLFITQGGLQSTDEAITAGVPLIGVPMLGDQWYNVEMYRRHKIGLRLDMDESLTEDLFRNAVKTVIEDESYRRNIIRLRTLMRDQPQSPLNRTIWWIEYVLRHKGAKHLRSPAANMSWAEFLELELVLTVLFFAAILFSAFAVIVYYAVKFISRNYMVDVKMKKS